MFKTRVIVVTPLVIKNNNKNAFYEREFDYAFYEAWIFMIKALNRLIQGNLMNYYSCKLEGLIFLFLFLYTYSSFFPFITIYPPFFFFITSCFFLQRKKHGSQGVFTFCLILNKINIEYKLYFFALLLSIQTAA